ATPVIRPRPRDREARHRQSRVLAPARLGLVVLQAVELTGIKLSRLHGRAHDDLDYRVRQTLDALDARDEVLVQRLDQTREILFARGLVFVLKRSEFVGEERRDLLVAVLR